MIFSTPPVVRMGSSEHKISGRLSMPCFHLNRSNRCSPLVFLTRTSMVGEDIRAAEGVLLAYSVTSRDSFEEIVTNYQQILRFKQNGRFSAILVANKCDLEEGWEVAKHGMSLSPPQTTPFNPSNRVTAPFWRSSPRQRVRSLPDTWGARLSRHPPRMAPKWMRHLPT